MGIGSGNISTQSASEPFIFWKATLATLRRMAIVRAHHRGMWEMDTQELHIFGLAGKSPRI